MKSLIFTFLFVFSYSAGASIHCSDFKKAVAGGSSSQKLKKFLDIQWKYNMTTFPEWATWVGFPGQNDRWTDRSLSAISLQQEETRCQLSQLKTIDPKSLSESDRLNYDLSLRNQLLAVENLQFPGEYLVIDQLGGLHAEVPDMLAQMPTANLKDYQNILLRLEKVKVLAEQTEALLKVGLEKKLTAVKQFLEKVPAQFDAVLTKDPKDSPLYAPFKEILISLEPAQKLELQTRALAIIEKEIYPSFTHLKNYLVTDYIPNARETISWSEMPNGKAWYGFLVKEHTTTLATADELHELGLREVARITSEMKKVKDEAKFKGDLKAFNKFLLEDPKFYYSSGEELLTGYRDIGKRLDAELPKLFGKLPRLPYGVRAVPDYKSKDFPTGQYMSGSLEGGRAGFFEANTHDLKSRPKWGMEALTLHEAVPGHHFQISIRQELEGIPEFRKYDSQTAYIEGWALYAESLGQELGMYKDVYSKYGALTYEILRAVRLVVDTGMHAKGWTREKALQYFMEAMPTTKLDAEIEIDRYITWPGQALAYKVGQLKIKELRTSAEKELRERFSIRNFHDEVLRHGSLPMDVLEIQIKRWISKQKSSVPKKG